MKECILCSSEDTNMRGAFTEKHSKLETETMAAFEEISQSNELVYARVADLKQGMYKYTKQGMYLCRRLQEV